MGLIRLFISLLVVGSLILGGIYLAEQRKLLPEGTFNGLIARVKSTQPQQVLKSTTQVTQMLSSQNPDASASGAVLGSSITVEKTEPPLSQKAFEYARYTYCKAAVADYESRFPSATP